MSEIMIRPMRHTALWLRAERDASGRWVQREVALRSDGVVVGRVGGPCEDWVMVQPWRAGAEVLDIVLRREGGYSRVE